MFQKAKRFRIDSDDLPTERSKMQQDMFARNGQGSHKDKRTKRANNPHRRDDDDYDASESRTSYRASNFEKVI